MLRKAALAAAVACVGGAAVGQVIKADAACARLRASPQAPAVAGRGGRGPAEADLGRVALRILASRTPQGPEPGRREPP